MKFCLDGETYIAEYNVDGDVFGCFNEATDDNCYCEECSYQGNCPAEVL